MEASAARVSTPPGKPVPRHAETGHVPCEKPRQSHKSKPYEQMRYHGHRVQIDVKVVPRACIADPELRLFQYTAIDECSRISFLGAYLEQSTYSSAYFLTRTVEWFKRRGVKVECVQTDNGFEFTNRFSHSTRDFLRAIKVRKPRESLT